MKIEYTQDEVEKIVEDYTRNMLGSCINDKKLVVSGYGTYSVSITDTDPEPADEVVEV